jgi:hypothetical protein
MSDKIWADYNSEEIEAQILEDILNGGAAIKSRSGSATRDAARDENSLPNYSLGELMKKLTESKREAQNRIEEEEETDEELNKDILNTLKDGLLSNLTGVTAAQTVETLEFFRHNRYRDLLLSDVSKPDKILAKNDSKIRKIIRERYIQIHGADSVQIKPFWWNLTPDAIIIKKNKFTIIDVAISRNPNFVRRNKIEKYQQLSKDIDADLEIYVHQDGNELKGIYDNEIVDDYFNSIQECINEVMNIIETNGLKNAYERKRKSVKPRRLRNIDIPIEFTELRPAKQSTIDEVNLISDIKQKSEQEEIFKKTTQKSIINGYEKAAKAIDETCDTTSPKNNSLNFLFSTERFGSYEKEEQQVNRFTNIFKKCNSKELKEIAELFESQEKGELKRITKTHARYCSNWLKLAKIKGFWEKEQTVEKNIKTRKKDPESGKHRSWSPNNESHINVAMSVNDELKKMDETYFTRYPIYCETDDSYPAVQKTGIEFANQILVKTQNTVGLAMCRFASQIGLKTLHSKGNMKNKFELWTGGFSANMIIKLPCDQPRSESSTVPFLSVSLIRNEANLILLTDIMYKETIMYENEKITIVVSRPQRLVLRQLEQWINADLEAINLIALHSRPKENYNNDVDYFPIGYVTMFCLNQHLSLSYLLESLKNVGQSSLSDYSRIEEFIEDKLSNALKSPFELLLWSNSCLWATKLQSLKPKSRSIIITNDDEESVLRSSTISIKYPSLFAIGKSYDLADIFNQISAPFMMRKKNQHDPIQGLSTLYGDITKLQLDWKGHDENINVKEMNTKSKFTYDERYIVASTNKAINEYYEPRKLDVANNMEESGMFDSHGLLATNRGSRKVLPDMAGFLIASTNIEESLLRESKTRVIDVAIDSLNQTPRFEFAQKEQKGKDRAIGITTFPYRCHLKCAEELAKSHSKVLPNEAMNKSGELKIKIAQNKITQLIKGRINEIEQGKATLVMISADNTKHSEHDAIDKYIKSWELHRHLSSEERGLVKTAITKMRERIIHLPKRLWNHYAKMIENPFEENKEIAEFWKSGSSQKMMAGWVQGMFNNISTKLHAEAQLYAIEVMKSILHRDIEMVGDVHSDDSWMALLIELREGDDAEFLHMKALNIYYYCMQCAGFRLNLKKTTASTNMMEFLSRFYILGDQVSTYVKSGIGVISPLPCRGPSIDMPSGIGKITQYLRDGGYLCMTYLMAALVMEQVNRLYSMGPGQVNDPTLKGAVKRSNIPLGFGGFYSGTPLALMMWGPKIHNLSLLNRYDQLHINEKRMLCAALPLYKGDFTNIKDAIGRQVDGGWRGPVNNPNSKKSIEKMKKKFQIKDLEIAKKIMTDHPVLRFEKPRTHVILMRFLRALIIDPDFAMGMEKATGIKTWLRIAKSVRGKIWRTGESHEETDEYGVTRNKPTMATLNEWFSLAIQTKTNQEYIDSFRECFKNSGGNLMLFQEQSIDFHGSSESERIPHTLKMIRPVPGEKAISESIGSMLMYKYDYNLYKEDGRVNHLNPEWKGQMDLLEEVVEKLPEDLPVDQEIGVVQSILNQDKMYRIYASLPHYRTTSPSELIRVMYTYNFYPNLTTDITFEPVPSSRYISPTFRMSRRSDLKRACGYIIGIHKWLITSNEKEGILIDRLREITYNLDEEDMTLDDLIEEGLQNSAITKPMKDDLHILKAFLRYGVDENFIDKEISDRFSQIQTNILNVEVPQLRSKVRKETWSGYCRLSVNMEPNMYTALEFDGEMKNTGKSFNGSSIEIARIVSNHKNEAAVNIAINLFRRYLGQMSPKDFMLSMMTESCLDGLQLIGEVFHRRTYEASESKSLIIWSYDPAEKAVISMSKLISYKITKTFDLIGEYPDGKNNKLRYAMLRKSWTWLHLPTQGIANWVDEDGLDTIRNYGVLQISFDELEKRKGIHQLAGSPSIDFAELIQCITIEGKYEDIKTNILKRFGENIEDMKQMTDELKGGQLLMIANSSISAEEEMAEFESKVEAIMNSSPFDMNLYSQNLANLEVEMEDEESDKDIKKGTMTVIRYKGGQNLAYSMTLGFRIMFATALNVYTKEDVVSSWPILIAIWRWVENKESEAKRKGWERTEIEHEDFGRFLKHMFILMECTTSFTYDEAPGREDYLNEIETNTMVVRIKDAYEEGRVDKVGTILEQETRHKRSTLYNELNYLIRNLIRNYEDLRRLNTIENTSFDIFN